MAIGTNLRAFTTATLLAVTACSDDGTSSGTGTSPTTATTATATTGTTTATTDGSGPTTATSDQPTLGGSQATTADPTDPTTGTTTEPLVTGTTAGGCGVCDQPNQQCIDDQCLTSCQGQDPSPCPQDQACDVISGTCLPTDALCTLAGPEAPCADLSCGPGSVCDGIGECVPIAPCGDVTCTDDGHCWGVLCGCERAIECQEPTAEQLNGPFSAEIGGIDFADDCNAWMVTLRSGPDYVRRLSPEGELTQWTGVANLNMGEVKVLRRLTIPQLHVPLPLAAGPVGHPEPVPVEGLGEVAITYTCCESCGCQVDPPQGVARLDEDNVDSPLPIIIVAAVTQGDGPFANSGADAGPQGLTWGENRILYVGNSTMNGQYNNADLDKAEQGVVFTFDARVTASAPISPVHILVALDGGDLYRFNALTNQAEFVLDLMSDVTSLSHDAFTGHVYAGLASLEVVKIAPFTGEIEAFQMMPGKGRVAVSPGGRLWYTPVKYIADYPLTSWDLPQSF